jgi:RNA polymerase sigma-70 factor (ECF subfamily)
MNRQETSALLRRAKGGSGEALDELYRRYALKLLRIIRLQLGPSLRDRLDSQDILQASLLKSFEKIDSFEREDGTSLLAWLSAISRNEIRDQAEFHGREKRDHRKDVDLSPDVAAAVPAEARTALSRAVLAEEAIRTERALESLPEEYRSVIVLRKLEERSWKEIGAALDRSEDAARMLLARAMAALTLSLERGDER